MYRCLDSYPPRCNFYATSAACVNPPRIFCECRHRKRSQPHHPCCHIAASLFQGKHRRLARIAQLPSRLGCKNLSETTRARQKFLETMPRARGIQSRVPPLAPKTDKFYLLATHTKEADATRLMRRVQTQALVKKIRPTQRMERQHRNDRLQDDPHTDRIRRDRQHNSKTLLPP